ncbi:MAG TPA: HDOD domain-containing protein [Polyangiaceae bacterium]
MASAIGMDSVEIDEELWFGSPGEDSELEERAAHSMAAVAARVLGAKPFPAAAKKLEEVTRGVDAKIERVVAVLESDPGLSMRLLRLVNSAGYALRVRCTSVRHAAALVGMRRLHQLATTAAVLDLFESDRPLVKSLLNHAASVGAVCRYLAVHVDLSPDELFTCGFLHDIGKLMLIDAEGQSYMDLVREAGDSPEALHLLEREKYGFDHAVLGAHVLKNWQIPNPVPRVVAWHHSVGRAYQSDTHTAAMVQTLRLADQLSYVLRTHPDAEGVRRAAESDSARYLGISEAQLSAMWPDLLRLSQRINAQPGSGGSEIIPREDSIPPSMRERPSQRAHSLAPSLAPAASLPPAQVSEMPKTFECVVCKKASHGSRCPVCSGHVCSEHQVGPEQWCSDCASVYKLDVQSEKTPSWVRYAAGATVVGSALISLVAAVLADTSLLGALVGSTLLSSVAVVALVVGRSVWLKRSFILRRGQVVESEPPLLSLGLAAQQEPEIAIRNEGPENLSLPVPSQPAPDLSVPSQAPLHSLSVSQAPPRWTRSELPSVLSFPPPSEPLRSEPHAYPHVMPSVHPEAPLPERVQRMRTDPVPQAPIHSAAPVHSAAPLHSTAQSPSVAAHAETLAGAGPLFFPEPKSERGVAEAVPDDAPEWRPIERTQPALAVPSFAPPSARPSPAAPLLSPSMPAAAAPPAPKPAPLPQAVIISGSAATAAEAPPPSNSTVEACKPPALNSLVACRPASMRPAVNACSIPSPR